MRVDGEKIQDPDHPENIYGGGGWWMIQADYIWRIENNGMDGDAWIRNNVNTGGAGACGRRIPYNKKIADLIREIGKK